MRAISNADGQLEKIDHCKSIQAPLIKIEAQYIARHSGKRRQSNRHRYDQAAARTVTQPSCFAGQPAPAILFLLLKRLASSLLGNPRFLSSTLRLFGAQVFGPSSRPKLIMDGI